ncbi:MAG: L-seryl-tRNA(Sec) selenium transferase [Deltaproteobacteria bacterium]|nr:L-seryl-tRNA(Sec) selenium transferase [Deltaproteobacteria bacterium]
MERAIDDSHRLLRGLPSVDELLRDDEIRRSAALCGASTVIATEAVRGALEDIRGRILSGALHEVTIDDIMGSVAARMKEALASRIRRVINASGTVLHTNIGRAILSNEAVEALTLAAEGCINLEMDIENGERGERDCLVEGLIKRLTGAENASIVNNNAAAVLITLNTLAEGGEVIVSRGELIEIGGSFRLPDIIKKSGCVLKEVGTTNRTHPRDYATAITENTALIFKAHTSNYRIVGFTAEVGLKELVEIGSARSIPVVEDLGSGSLVDLTRWGLPREPVAGESIASGAGIVLFSGDKLLGGPQAGVIAGRKDLVDRIRKNPLKRALRADKLTLSALEATLRLYLNEDTLPRTLPVLRHMARPLSEIDEAAQTAAALLGDSLGDGFTIEVEDGESVVGGGSLPGHNLKTRVVSITHGTTGPERIFRYFLNSDPSILGRVSKGRFILDMRTVERPGDVVPAGVFVP